MTNLKRLTKGIITSLLFGVWLTCPAVASSDWVEDDSLNGFYKHQINKDGSPPSSDELPQTQPRKPMYRTLGDPTPSPEDSEAAPTPAIPSYRMSGGEQDEDSPFDVDNTGGLYAPVTVPPSAMMQAPQAPAYQNQGEPQKKSLLSKIGSFGKSVARLPVDAVEGAGETLSNPYFWQGAGALAGAGANAYMNYQFMKNNPGFYNNPYYGGYGGYGGYGYGAYDPYFGGGYPGYGYGGYGGYGGFGGLYGGYGGYGGYNPYLSGRAYIPGSSLNSFGSLAPQSPATQALRNSYNNAVNNSGLSNYDKYWLRQNPNPTLFGF